MINGHKLSIAIAILLSSCLYALIYILDLCFPIKQIIPSAYKPKTISYHLANENLIVNKNELRTWIFKGYNQNMFFHTIACLIALVSCEAVIIDVLAYIGTLALWGQVISLYFFSDTLCGVCYCVSSLVNALLLAVSILIY